MEGTRQAYELGVRGEIEAKDNYSKCANFMPLCYAILYKEQLLNSGFLLNIINPMDIMTK